MKITIDIADDIFERAKALAQREKTTLTMLIEEGLHLVLDRRHCYTQVKIEPVVFHGHGLREGLPADFIDKIRDWAYEDEPE